MLADLHNVIVCHLHLSCLSFALSLSRTVFVSHCVGLSLILFVSRTDVSCKTKTTGPTFGSSGRLHVHVCVYERDRVVVHRCVLACV